MVVLAFLSDPNVVKRILAHLALPTAPPPLGRAHDTEFPAEDTPCWTDDLAWHQALGDAPDAPAGRDPPWRSSSPSATRHQPREAAS